MENIFIVMERVSNNEEIYSLDRCTTLRGVFTTLEDAKNALEPLVDLALEEHRDVDHYPITEPERDGVVYQEVYCNEILYGELSIYSIPANKITEIVIEHALYIE